MLPAVSAYYSPGKGDHGRGSGGGGLSPSQMLRSGPSTFPCPQLTIQKVWQTLEVSLANETSALACRLIEQSTQLRAANA
jgi:hypothetical protein